MEVSPAVLSGTPDTKTFDIDDTEVTVDHCKLLAAGGARVDVHTDDQQWRLDVTRGGNYELVTAWRPRQRGHGG